MIKVYDRFPFPEAALHPVTLVFIPFAFVVRQSHSYMRFLDRHYLFENSSRNNET